MGQNDEGLGADNAEKSDAPSGPRRSTFTPAPAEAYEQVFGHGSRVHDDNAVPSDAPPPSAASVITPSPGSALPNPPRRRSLADDELMTTLETEALKAGGSLEAIDRLQQQLLLREQEAREFHSWESSMLAIGTPEALDVVEETRLVFTDVINIIRPSPSTTVAEPLTPSDSRTPTDFQIPGEPLTPSDPSAAIFDLVEPEDPQRLIDEEESPGFELGLADGDTEDNDAGDDNTAPGDIVAPGVEATTLKVFDPETSGTEPTQLEHRAGRAARLFWLWFAANSSVLSVVFGGILLSLGMSLRQAIVAALAGGALSFLPLGLGTLASKWNGQPTMVVSRASFGLVGNILPATLSLVTRLFWGAVLLWFLATMTARILVGTGLSGGLTELQFTIATAGATFLIALVAAFFGYALISRIQFVLSIVSGALILILVAITWPLIDIAGALTIGDGPWILVLTGAILVFSYVGLVWSTSSGDLARYQRPSSSGAVSMLIAPFGSALPAFLLIVYGSLLAASDRDLAFGFVTNPIDTLATVVPAWFILPLIGAIGLGLLSGVILSIYSGGFALQALGARLRREAAIIVVGLALGASAIAMTLLPVDLNLIFRDLATTLAVPTAAWVGIFAAEVMIRNRRFDARSLVQPGGVYPAVNWVNLSMLVVATAIGFGLTTAAVSWLSWQGYLFSAVGISSGSDLARADIGVLVALVFGLLTPIIAGIPTIRRQEQARD